MPIFIFNFPYGIEFSLSVLASCKFTGFLFECREFLFHVEATTSLAFSVQDLIVISYHRVVSADSKYTQMCGEAPSSVFCTTTIIQKQGTYTYLFYILMFSKLLDIFN